MDVYSTQLSTFFVCVKDKSLVDFSDNARPELVITFVNNDLQFLLYNLVSIYVRRIFSYKTCCSVWLDLIAIPAQCVRTAVM